MTAWIESEVEYKADPLSGRGVGFVTSKWCGDGDIAELHHTSLFVNGYGNVDFSKNVITYNNLRLRIIDRESFYLKVARDGRKSRLYQAIWPVKKWWLWVWYRLILTLAVWGLATHEPGRIPNWKDIKWFKKS